MKYRIIVSGGNLLVADETKKTFDPRLRAAPALGFVTTRMVTASSRREACELAIESARQELQKSSDVFVTNDPSNPPTFEIAEIDELDDRHSGSASRTGFTFFPDDRTVQ